MAKEELEKSEEQLNGDKSSKDEDHGPSEDPFEKWITQNKSVIYP